MTIDQPSAADRELAATELAQHLADIAAVLLLPGSVEATAQRIVTLARATLDSCDEASLCTRPGEAAPSGGGELVRQLHELQARGGEGPCADALAGEDTVHCADLAHDDRWPAFCAGAIALGVRSALVYRLVADAQTVGALQLFARQPQAFDAHERAQGLVFATYAGSALSLALSQQEDRQRVDDLRQALSSREVIGQAQGILMERERVTADQAFDLLRRASQRLNLKLRAVAQELVDTGVVPDGAGS